MLDDSLSSCKKTKKFNEQFLKKTLQAIRRANEGYFIGALRCWSNMRNETQNTYLLSKSKT